MNNEKYNQIIDEAYKNYYNYMTTNFMETRWCKVEISPDGKSIMGRMCNRDEFIIESKTQPGFSERWGLKIEERELNLDERAKLHPNPENFYNIHGTFSICDSIENSDFPNKDWLHKQFDDRGIPTKLITITYNNETIEIYE